MAIQRETPIEVFEGDDKLITVRLRRRDPDGTLNPLDLSGNTAITFTVKADPKDTTVLFDYTLADGEIVVTDDGSGAADEYSELTIQFLGTDTSGRGGKKLRYALKWTNAGGKGETVAYGPLLVANI